MDAPGCLPLHSCSSRGKILGLHITALDANAGILMLAGVVKATANFFQEYKGSNTR